MFIYFLIMERFWFSQVPQCSKETKKGMSHNIPEDNTCKFLKYEGKTVVSKPLVLENILIKLQKENTNFKILGCSLVYWNTTGKLGITSE